MLSYDGFIEFDAFNTDLKKIIERMMSGFERAIKNENLKGNLEIGVLQCVSFQKEHLWI